MIDPTTTTVVSLPATRGFFGHPRGLSTLFFTEMWERFSYYGMRALLMLYMTGALSAGGLGIDAERAGAIYGLYTAAVYLCSLPGGWVADRLLGQQKSVFWGGVLIALGNLMLAVPAGAPILFTGLLVISLGTGLLKPNVSCLVGELYKGDSGSRRDAAFSIYYLGINLGSFIAPFVAGTVGETVGYRWGFFSAGIAMVFGLIQYRFTGHWLGDAGVAPHSTSERERRRGWWVLWACLAVVAIVAAAMAFGTITLDVLKLAQTTEYAMSGLAVAFFGGVLLFAKLDAAEKKRVGVIAVFFVCAALFWSGYEQAGSSLNLFARDFTDRSFLGSWFASGQHPTSWYQSFQAIYVLLLAPVFAWLWLTLGKRGKDPSAPGKFGLGLIQCGLSFVVIAVAAQLLGSAGNKVLPTWLALTYLLQTTGELCLSPIGLSNVTKLAPRRFVGQMMGTWFLGAAIGNLAAGRIGGRIAASPVSAMPAQYLAVALTLGVAGVVMLLVARTLHRWTGGAE
jgi:proton-dependent oligopeptide transporter, POT family